MPSVTTTNTVNSSGIRLMRKTSCVGGANDQSANSSSQHTNPDRKSLRDQPNVGKYKLIRTLGRGNFAKVKLAQHVSTGREVAVKVIDKTQLNQASLKKLFREVNIMKMLNHPNIVRLYEVIESERHVYLVMEYAENGEVFDHLVAHGRMKEREARAAFRQIVSAVEYCHQKKIVHRDLKAENLLFDGYFNIKLADFGFSNLFDGAKKLDTFCGSPPYAAPELFQGRKYDGPEVDVWSLGVILYTLVSGSLPFDAQHLKDLQERVLRGKYRVPFYMSTDCEALLRKLLVLNPSKRITLRNVMTDKWLNIGYEDNVLKPYVEPPTDYNDTERLEIMRKMGYRPDDVREALIKQSFNNVTAIYLLLADPKTRLTLPTGSLSPSNQSQSQQGNITSNHHHKSSSSEDVVANSTAAVGVVDEATTSKVQSILENANGNNNKLKTNQNGLTHQQKKGSEQHGDSASQFNGVRRSSGISWIKQSASAGPTSNRQEKLSVDEKSRLLPRIRVSDLRERGNDSPLDNSGQVEIDESNETTESSNCGVEQSTVRRINTFSMSDKVRPSGSDSQSPSLKCPLSRAPPMSNIPNSLTATTPITSSSENSPSKQPVDKSSSSSASSSSPSKDNNDNFKETPFSEQPVKLNKAVPYTEENPNINSNSFFGWLRRTLPYRKHHKDASVHSKPTTTTCSNNNKIPSNAIKDNFIFDVLDPNDRQKYQQDYVNRPTTLYSVFNNTTNNDTKSKQLKKVTNQSNDQKPSESFAINESHSSTLDASSSSGTMNSTRVTHYQHNNQSSSPSRQIPLPDSIFKALDTDENSENKCNSKSHVFKSPTTTASIKRDSLIKWSVRHRPDNTITSNNNDIPSTEPKQLICKKNLDANQNMKQSTELKNSDSSMNLETPTTTTSKNGSSSAYSRPGRFFRSLTLRIARSFRCGRFKSGHHHHPTNRIISSMRKSNKPNNNTTKTVNSKSDKTNLMKLNNKEEITDYDTSNPLNSSSSATSSSHPSSTTTQHDDENDDTMKCCHASANPDPWITMEPGYQQQQNQRKISTNIASKWKRSSSSELDTSKLKRHPPLHHDGFEFPFNTPPNESVITSSQQKTELEPPCLNLSTTKTTIISSDMHKCKAATITTPQSTISPMLTTVFTTKNNFNTTSSYVESSNSQQYLHHYDDQNESRKLWKPRRLHFVLHLPIIGNDPYILLMKLIDTLKHYQCTYHFLNSYRLHCTKLLNSSLMNYNDNIDHNEQYKPLITSIETNNQQLIQSTLLTMNSVDKCNLLTWDMEIFQLAKPINYGVRFKRISGNRNAFKIIRKYFLQEFTNKLC